MGRLEVRRHGPQKDEVCLNRFWYISSCVPCINDHHHPADARYRPPQNERLELLYIIEHAWSAVVFVGSHLAS